MPDKNIPKAYEPQKVEDGLYKKWEDSGLFRPDMNARGKPFSIAMPPPNATGTLHLGHAVMLALEDIMIRHARMNGRKTLWVPGTDHASIATENKVEKNLLEKKGKTKQELGREAFLKEVESFVADSQSTIKNQVRKMGASCDWSHERYTLDEGLSRTVSEVFIKMHNDGLIYRGHRIVNWCTRCQSTLADDEVEYKEQYAPFYYLKYGPVVIGTARPETKVLDKVIIVHPDDKRYKKYIGKTLDVPWIDGTVKAAFVADIAADMDFGSGAMTITPAHSFVDFELAQKHGFEIKQIIGPDGKLTKNSGAFAGMLVAEAREAIVKALQKKGLVEKIDENYVHNLSVCYRCDTPVEPLVSEQWFVDVDKKIPAQKTSLKEMAIRAVKSGDIEIIPDRFNKTYFHWMENLHDWCISRQIWFGHRIPVWYCSGDDKHQCKLECKNPIIQIEQPKACPHCGSKMLRQDPDTLDTWFSSALWTFSTLLDAPKKNDTLDSWIKRNKKKGADLATFHPTSIMETGYDILFFWVARMILMTTYALGEVPFKKVYLHGLVRDQKGRKMSKSLGNGIDPLDMIAQYGADATRLSLVIGTTVGNDTRLYEEKVAGYRNFVNKIWNISRFILMHQSVKATGSVHAATPTLADQWIESRLQNLIADVDQYFERFEFSAAGEKIYNFLWHELADWYLEISKQQSHTIAPAILLDGLKLLHPFTPFVTEEIYQLLKKEKLVDADDKFLAGSPWPKAQPKLAKPKIEENFTALQELVTSLRDLRAKHNLPYAEILDAAITTATYKNLFQEQELVVERLTKIRIQVLPTKPAGQEEYVRVHTSSFDIYLKIGKDHLHDQEARLAKARKNLEQYITGLEAKLSNKQFTKNAPKAVVEQKKKKLKDARSKLEKNG
ncbi:MAG: valine--tRNA ligase [Parcubacteria group bacterium]|nr:valine--tRNA ligase [Parcubacteria group bacterium]